MKILLKIFLGIITVSVLSFLIFLTFLEEKKTWLEQIKIEKTDYNKNIITKTSSWEFILNNLIENNQLKLASFDLPSHSISFIELTNNTV